MLTAENIRRLWNSMGFKVKPGCPHCMKKFKSWALAKKHVKYCRKGSHPRRTIGERIHKGENKNMSIRDEFKKKSVDAPPLLHGEDLPRGKASVIITVREIRTAPDNFNSIAVIDLAKPVFKKESWAVNKTNMKALLEKFNLDDSMEMDELSKILAGKKLTLARVMVNNPQTKKIGPSLFIA